MFKKGPTTPTPAVTPTERVTSILGPGITWRGNLGGKGGIRIEGTFEGEITLRGLVVIGATGRLTCKELKANTVIIAGAVQGNITAEKLEIRSTGRVWGDVVAGSFATEEGAFLRGQIRMEEKVDLDLGVFEETAPVQAPAPAMPALAPEPAPEVTVSTEPVIVEPVSRPSTPPEEKPDPLFGRKASRKTANVDPKELP